MDKTKQGGVKSELLSSFYTWETEAEKLKLVQRDRRARNQTHILQVPVQWIVNSFTTFVKHLAQQGPDLWPTPLGTNISVYTVLTYRPHTQYSLFMCTCLPMNTSLGHTTAVTFLEHTALEIVTLMQCNVVCLPRFQEDFLVHFKFWDQESTFLLCFRLSLKGLFPPLYCEQLSDTWSFDSWAKSTWDHSCFLADMTIALSPQKEREIAGIIPQ